MRQYWRPHSEEEAGPSTPSRADPTAPGNGRDQRSEGPEICARRSDDTNGTSLGANRYRDWTCEYTLFLLFGLDSRGLHLKPYVSRIVKK
jgi:hypothetical protein